MKIKFCTYLLIMFMSVFSIYYTSETYTANTTVLFKYEKLVGGTTYPYFTVKEKEEIYDVRVHPMTYGLFKTGDVYQYVRHKRNDVINAWSIVIMFFSTAWIILSWASFHDDSIHVYMPAKYS
jgi:hypothetical protein